MNLDAESIETVANLFHQLLNYCHDMVDISHKCFNCQMIVCGHDMQGTGNAIILVPWQ